MGTRKEKEGGKEGDATDRRHGEGDSTGKGGKPEYSIKTKSFRKIHH